MKLKVKKCQRRNASLNKSNLQIFCCLAYALLAICLLESFYQHSYVDAYIPSARNATNLFESFDIQYLNDSSKDVLSHNRSGRFLFDAFFGIDTPPLDASDLDDDDDDDEEDIPKPCKCGRYCEYAIQIRLLSNFLC